jgi:hypothetical protein
MAEAGVAAASLFGADRRLCSADILPPAEVRARIEVAVLNFLAALTDPAAPAISALPLISRGAANRGLRRALLRDDVSSVYLSYASCKRSLTRANDAKAFVRGCLLMISSILFLKSKFHITIVSVTQIHEDFDKTTLSIILTLIYRTFKFCAIKSQIYEFI